MQKMSKKRKHEKFSWSGYKYAPESVNFALNGKRIYMPEDIRSRIAYLAVCDENEKAIIELKRFLRKEEKKMHTLGRCICFYKEGSDKEFYYSEQLMYRQYDIQDALHSYKEWKRYKTTRESPRF